MKSKASLSVLGEPWILDSSGTEWNRVALTQNEALVVYTNASIGNIE